MAPPATNLMNTGQHGVTIFFVLSEFLITRNLFTRPGNLKNLYIRRFFRLVPVVWTYLALPAAVSFCTGVPFSKGRDSALSALLSQLRRSESRGAMTGHF